ncbi:MAG: hypothetical protein M0C28_33025 [Candidatus Moduliflexus flocculans]|nr:hypothetical protein [Candidatus Moduliflexus flocculans]
MSDETASPRTVPNPDRPLSPGVTRLGSTVVLNGDIEAHEDMLVEGRVQGKIALPSGTLTVAKGGRGRSRGPGPGPRPPRRAQGHGPGRRKDGHRRDGRDERRRDHAQDHHRQRRPLLRRHPDEGVKKGARSHFCHVKVIKSRPGPFLR